MGTTPIGGNLRGVYNPSVANRAANAIRTQKTILTGFFNSNGLKDGHGVVSGLHYAAVNNNVRLFGMTPYTIGEFDQTTNAYAPTAGSYMQRGWTGSGASQIASKNPNSESAGGMCAVGHFRNPVTTYPGYSTNYKFGGGFTGSSKFSTPFAPWVSVAGADYFAGSGSPKASSRMQIYVQSITGTSFDFSTKRFTGEYWYGRYSLSGGSFTPGAVCGSVPNGWYPGGNAVSSGYTQGIPSNAGATSDTVMSLRKVDMTGSSSLTSGVGNIYVGIGFGLAYDASRTGFTGDMFLGYCTAYETGATNGVMVAPFWAVGTQSMYDFAYALHPSNPNVTHQNTIDHWIDVMKSPVQCTSAGATSQDPCFVWVLCDAVNSASETSASISAGHTAYSAEAYADNATYVMGKIMERWVAKGLSASKCLFWLYPDHTVPDGDPTFTTHRTRIAEYVTRGYDLIYAQYPNNMFGSIPENLVSATSLFNTGLSADTYYAFSQAANTATAIELCTGASAAAEGVVIRGTFAAGTTTGAYVRVRNSNSTPIINGIHYVSAGLTNGIRVRIPSLTTGVTVAGTTALVSLLDWFHLGVPVYNTGLSADSLNGYHRYVNTAFTDMMSSLYTDYIRDNAGGLTGVQTISESSKRKIVAVSGIGSDTFTITSGLSSGTANSWSASNMEVRSLAWSVSPGSSVGGHVQILFENQGSGGTHATIMNCVKTNNVAYYSDGIALKNLCDNPTGNILVRSYLGASGAYTALLEITKPTSQNPYTST
jgi:hypothetical protein